MGHPRHDQGRPGIRGPGHPDGERGLPVPRQRRPGVLHPGPRRPQVLHHRRPQRLHEGVHQRADHPAALQAVLHGDAEQPGAGLHHHQGARRAVLHPEGNRAPLPEDRRGEDHRGGPAEDLRVPAVQQRQRRGLQEVRGHGQDGRRHRDLPGRCGDGNRHAPVPADVPAAPAAARAGRAGGPAGPDAPGAQGALPLLRQPQRLPLQVLRELREAVAPAAGPDAAAPRGPRRSGPRSRRRRSPGVQGLPLLRTGHQRASEDPEVLPVLLRAALPIKGGGPPPSHHSFYRSFQIHRP